MKNYFFIRVFFIFISALFIFLSAFGSVADQGMEILVLAFVVTVGMSHGSLDWLLAEYWGLRKNLYESLRFFIVYAAIVICSLLVWALTPTLALLIFLVMSAVHFGSDWLDELPVYSSLLVGVAIISLPAVSFSHEIISLFSLLVNKSSAILLVRVMHLVGYFSFVALSMVAYRHAKLSPFLAIELMGLLLISVLLPPIVYLSLYFCLLHTTKHWLKMKKIGLYLHLKEALWSAIWPTALCIAVGAFTCYQTQTLAFSQALIRTVFIGLSALTVPHWILLEIYPKTKRFSDSVAIVAKAIE